MGMACGLIFFGMYMRPLPSFSMRKEEKKGRQNERYDWSTCATSINAHENHADSRPLLSSRRKPMNRLQELRDLLTTFEKDFVKFYEKGNKSAGTRVRKHMNELKRKAQEIRKEVQDIKAVDKTGEPAAPEQQ